MVLLLCATNRVNNKILSLTFFERDFQFSLAGAAKLGMLEVAETLEIPLLGTMTTIAKHLKVRRVVSLSDECFGCYFIPKIFFLTIRTHWRQFVKYVQARIGLVWEHQSGGGLHEAPCGAFVQTLPISIGRRRGLGLLFFNIQRIVCGLISWLCT